MHSRMSSLIREDGGGNRIIGIQTVKALKGGNGIDIKCFKNKTWPEEFNMKDMFPSTSDSHAFKRKILLLIQEACVFLRNHPVYSSVYISLLVKDNSRLTLYIFLYMSFVLN